PGRAGGAPTPGPPAAAAALVSSCRPDLALVDLHMPPPGGIRAVAAIRRTTPRVRVVAMSGSADPGPAVEALRAGAEGFLPKTSEPEELLPPLLAILDGWAVLPAELLRAMLLGPTRSAPVDLDGEERRLLRAIAAGRNTVDIAEELHVSERTVKRMTAALLRKLRVSNRAEAAAIAGHSGILGE
ncbi:response regulator transcription factor, partial [Micromonospora sp. NPDC049089]|uniref:response regulator transcription factor n=1 Tax=Micromonospora sp. NPDC049089 TaxID=3155496 RepID=UPI0033DB5ECD